MYASLKALHNTLFSILSLVLLVGYATQVNADAETSDPLARIKLPTMLADASDITDSPGAEEERADNYEVCAAFRADIDADLGKVLRAGCEPTLAQMSALMDNPIGNVAMLFNQVDAYRMEEPESGTSKDQYNYMLLAQFPKKLTPKWNLINRFVLNYTSVPLEQDDIDDFAPPPVFGGDFDYGTGPGNNPTPPENTPLPVELFGGRTSNLGDSYYVGLFAPNDPIKLDNGAKLLWGLGFDLGFDTAQEDILGTGKWTAGPSALGVYMGETFKGGALVQHYWDYAGDGDRNDVNMTNIQYLYYWSLNETTSIGAGPNFIINWEQNSDNRYTLPVGMGINRTFQFGKLPVRIGLEYFYTAIQPDDVVGSDWSVRFYVIPAVPSALFDWMQ
ncbi:MAG: hypothetical protein ABJ308_15250 [Halieaceae bacterium]